MKLNLFLYKLENKIRRFAIERLMTVITVAMAIVFVADFIIMLYTDGEAISINYLLAFDRALIFKGQVWRVISFIFAYPQSSNILLTLLSLYFFYWSGTAVENYCGKARFTLFYLFGVIGTIIAGLIVGGMTNAFLNLTLFLAFATIYPEMRVMLFFIIPIKVKWLGIIEGASLLLLFIFGSWVWRAAILAAIANYLLFFGYDLISKIKRAYEDYKWQKNNNNYY